MLPIILFLSLLLSSSPLCYASLIQLSPNGISANYSNEPAATIALSSMNSSAWAKMLFAGIQEVDMTGAVVAEARGFQHLDRQWQLQLNESLNTTAYEIALEAPNLAVTPNGTISPFNVVFKLDTFFALKNFSRTSANEEIRTDSGELRWQLQVSGWQFQKPENKLRFVVQLLSSADMKNISEPTNFTTTSAPTSTPSGSTTTTAALSTTTMSPNGTNTTSAPTSSTTTMAPSNTTTMSPLNTTTMSPFNTTTLAPTNTTMPPITLPPITLPPFTTLSPTIPPSQPSNPRYSIVPLVPGTLSSMAIIFGNNTANLIIPTVALEDDRAVQNISVNVVMLDGILTVHWDFPSFNQSLIYDPVMSITRNLAGNTSIPTSPPEFNTTMPPFNTTMPPFNTTMPPFNTTLPPEFNTTTTLPPEFNTTTLPPEFNTTTLPPEFNTTTLPPGFNTTLPPEFNTTTTLPPGGSNSTTTMSPGSNSTTTSPVFNSTTTSRQPPRNTTAPPMSGAEQRAAGWVSAVIATAMVFWLLNEQKQYVGE